MFLLLRSCQLHRHTMRTYNDIQRHTNNDMPGIWLEIYSQARWKYGCDVMIVRPTFIKSIYSIKMTTRLKNEIFELIKESSSCWLRPFNSTCTYTSYRDFSQTRKLPIILKLNRKTSDFECREYFLPLLKHQERSGYSSTCQVYTSMN